MSGSKKNLLRSTETKHTLIDPSFSQISPRRQCQLLGLARSSWHYQPAAETPENLELPRLLDQQYISTPFYGTRRLREVLRGKGYLVNRKRIRRLMQILAIEAMAPKPGSSKPGIGHKIYPYLLRNYKIIKPNQVWSTDITYIPMARGFMYLVAIIDWYSRYVLSWSLSNSLETEFCLESLSQALLLGRAEIFNSDQGSQFTSERFVRAVESSGMRVSMDGRGRCLDNIFIERFWRSLKYEDVYIKSYDSVAELTTGLSEYIEFYNQRRFHQSLNYQTPYRIHFGA